MHSKAISKTAAIIIAVIVIIAIIAGAAMMMAPKPTAKKIIWVSTQLNPPEEQAFVKDVLLKEFKEETGIEVEFVASSYEDLATRLESEEKAGKVTISVIGELHGGLDYFASKGWLEDLSKFGTLSGRTFPKVLEDYSHLYGIKAYVPWMTATYVMVVNKKAFDYLPEGLTKEDVLTGSSKWTCEAFLEWAKNLYEKTGGPKVGFPAGPKGLFVRFLHGYLYPAFTGAQVVNFASGDAVKLWEYLKELWKYVHPSSTTWDAMADPLLKGEVWIAWDHTARIKDAIVNKPDEFVVVPVPAGPKGRGFILVIAGLAIPKGAPNQDAAWKLIEYLTRPETQVKVLENVGFFPSVQEASAKVTKGALKILADGVGKQLATPDALVALIPSLGAKGGDFKNVYLTAFQRIVLNNEDIRTVINELAPQLMNLFKETGAPLPMPDAAVTPSPTTTTTPATSPKKKVKIAVVSDIGGRGDLSFNDMAFKGADEAAKDFGVEVIELISKTEADYLPNLRAAAKDPDVVLVVGVGFLLSDALLEVAQEFPDKNFAGIDTYTQALAKEKLGHYLPNMLDIKFEEHKGSALVGALACLLAAHYDYPHVGMVLGIEIPVLWKFEIGYKWGCDWALKWYKEHFPEEYEKKSKNPNNILSLDVKDRVLWTYTGTFSDITKGYEAAKEMYAKGAIAVYNVAGPLGLGINQAVEEIAKEKGLDMGPPFWIGVDADQDWINPGFVIASMMKRVDKGVYYATKLVLEGKFRDIVKRNEGVLLLGIGTKVDGELMEGISISTLDDLDEFIQMGIEAEKMTGKKILPMPPEEIKAKVKAMREAQPEWIWQAVKELEEKIRKGEVEVPLPLTKEDIEHWRSILG